MLGQKELKCILEKYYLISKNVFQALLNLKLITLYLYFSGLITSISAFKVNIGVGIITLLVTIGFITSVVADVMLMAKVEVLLDYYKNNSIQNAL